MNLMDIVILISLVFIIIAVAAAVQIKLDYQQNVAYNNAITMQE